MNVPVKQMEPYDIIVVGGGIAGVSAAVSAARLGKNVLLIEKSMNLGGLATRGLISWYEPLCDGTGTQRAGGLAEELLKLATENGFDNLPPDWNGHSNNAPRNDRYSTYFSPTFFSLSLVWNKITQSFRALCTKGACFHPFFLCMLWTKHRKAVHG